MPTVSVGNPHLMTSQVDWQTANQSCQDLDMRLVDFYDDNDFANVISQISQEIG